MTLHCLRSLFVIPVFLASSAFGAASPFDLSSIRLDSHGSYVTSDPIIRVKVFPHGDHQPQRDDQVRDRLVLTSEKPCVMLQGHETAAQGTKKILGKNTSFILEAATLVHPAYFKCQTPIALARELGRASYAYAGALYVRRVATVPGKWELEAINVVPMNEYLRGVVPSEVYPGWHLETLKSQAVAARSYGVFHLAFARTYLKTRFYDVDDTVAFQAYTGVTHARRETDEAVAATAGQVLTFKNEVIQAYYHADSGGATEDGVEAWGHSIPFCLGKREDVYRDHPAAAWEITVAFADLTKVLREQGAIASSADVTALSIADHTESGRVRALALALRDGKDQAAARVSVGLIRRVVGNLPSTLFTVRAATRTTVILRGFGSGHGIGMNQTGAEMHAANRGWDYRRILDFYYTGTGLCSLEKNLRQAPTAGVPSCFENDFLSRDIFAANN